METGMNSRIQSISDKETKLKSEVFHFTHANKIANIELIHKQSPSDKTESQEIYQRLLELERLSHSSDIIFSGLSRKIDNPTKTFDDIAKVGRSSLIIVKFLTVAAKERFFVCFLSYKNFNLSDEERWLAYSYLYKEGQSIHC